MIAKAFKKVLWENFGAAIDMLVAAVKLCPVAVWQQEKKFFYLTYHTTIFLDYYLTNPVAAFKPLLPYTLTENNKIPVEAIDDVVPNTFYTQEEIIAYLEAIRIKCKNLILESSEEKLMTHWIKEDEINLHGLCPSLVEKYSILQILLYNLRHVQHHLAQLNFILRQKINRAPDWISHAD